MSNDELKTAMKQRLPVICKGIEYLRIEEYVLRFDQHGAQKKSCVLVDKNGNSLVRVPAEEVELKRAYNGYARQLHFKMPAISGETKFFF